MSVSRPDARQRLRDAERFATEILPRVSRTFAISIRWLPGHLGRAVLGAYLLCRIADTVEDDASADVARKAELLDGLLLCFDDAAVADAYDARVTDIAGDPAHVELLRNTSRVFVLFRSLPLASQRHVRRWVGEMVRGMKKFVQLYPRGIRIETLAEYKEYCYYVAGTVGLLLTDLWHEHRPLTIGRARYEALRAKCREFGEALQTVNILKDIAWDAEHENAIYIPGQALRAQGSSHEQLLSASHQRANHVVIADFIALASRDLDEALEYTLTIPRRALAIRVFCILPLLFAHATLRDLMASRAMLRSGGQVKIARAEVKALLLVGPLLICSNAGLRWLVAKVQAKPFTLGAEVPAAQPA
ncbi:MAG: squalene/phytoene synthase family protein [Gemmatimonadetes bacterium]|nr:squalene/phytoene synthase family protein [Gemmatimonadota bacterium]